MRRVYGTGVLLLVAVLTHSATADALRTWDFEAVAVGGLPPGFEPATGRWAVAAPADETTGHVLAQTHVGKSPEFNVALVAGTDARDVDVSVRLRAMRGEIDRGGGVTWRAKDAKSYYVARYNPLEDNFRAYHVVNGKRRQIASADVALDQATWHTLRVVMVGEHIEAFLDGKKLLDVRDRTLDAAGRIGLWTKADAETEFDDLKLEVRNAGR